MARGSRSARPLESVLCTVGAHSAEVAMTNENDKTTPTESDEKTKHENDKNTNK